MVFEILKLGEENALSPEYLRTSLGFRSTRALQKQIEKEREQGKVILSSATPPGGYYRPKRVSEIERFVKTLEHRGNKTLAALESAQELLNQIRIGRGRAGGESSTGNWIHKDC